MEKKKEDGSTRVSIGRKVTSVNWVWNRNQVQSSLNKSGLTLSLDEDLRSGTPWGSTDSGWSLVSLVICLMQHITRTPTLSSLNGIYENLSSNGKCSEEIWVQFSVALTKIINAKNYPSQESGFPLLFVHNQVESVCKVLDNFQWFGFALNHLKITCIVPGKEVDLIHNAITSESIDRSKLKNIDTLYLWHDVSSATYNGIVERYHAYPTLEAYKTALSFELSVVAKAWFRQQLEECYDDDKFVSLAMSYNQHLSELGREYKDFDVLLQDTWQRVDPDLRTLCYEILNSPMSGEENESVSSRSVRPDESDLAMVKRELFLALVSATDDSKAMRDLNYEAIRTKAIEDKLNSEERHLAEVRKIKTEMNRLTEQLEGTEGIKTIDCLARAAISGSSVASFPDAEGALQNEIDVRERAKEAKLREIDRTKTSIVDELKKQQELLTWAKLQGIIAGSVSPYELALRRNTHSLFKIDNSEQLIDEAIKMLDNGDFGTKDEKSNNPLTEQDRQLIRSYVKRMVLSNQDAVVFQEFSKLLREMVSEPQWNTSNPAVLKVYGRALVLSEIIINLKHKKSSQTPCKELLISADDTIYIDVDWEIPGVSLGLSSGFSIQAIGGGRVINTSGKDAVPHQLAKAIDGQGPGMNGNHGLDGNPGESAGCVTVVCKKFSGKLVIKASGGRGADGQHGGDGADGTDGKDGVDGKLPNGMQNYKYYSTRVALILPGMNVYDMVQEHGTVRGTVSRYFAAGTKGEPGMNGGDGGNAGRGGDGGSKGTITINCSKIYGDIDSNTYVKDGENGSDGKAGNGSKGGKGGRNGLDAARVFEPNDLNPWLWVTGAWKEDRGIGLALEEVKRTSDRWVMGYKIIRKASSESESNGRHGQKGKEVESAASQRKSSTSQNSVCSESISAANKLFAFAEAGSEAQSQADQLAQSVALKQEALEIQKQSVLKQDSQTNALKLALSKAKDLTSSALKNEEDTRRAEQSMKQAEAKAAGLEKGCQRMKQSFQKAESVIMSNKSQRSSEQVHRMVDQRAGDEDGFQEEEENLTNRPQKRLTNIYFGEDDDLAVYSEQTPAPKINTNSTGLDILDALLSRFIAAGVSEDAIQTLSMLSQALVLQVLRYDESDYLDDPLIVEKRRNAIWDSIKEILHCYLHPAPHALSTFSNGDHLAQTIIKCLMEINRDVELVRAIQRAGPFGQDVLEILVESVREKISSIIKLNNAISNLRHVNETDGTGVLFHYRILPWTYEEIEKTYNQLFNNANTKEKNIKACYELLERMFAEHFLQAVSKEIYAYYLSYHETEETLKIHENSANDESNRAQSILKELRQVILESKTITDKSTSAAVFYRQYMEAIERLRTNKEYKGRASSTYETMCTFSKTQLQFCSTDVGSLEKWLFSPTGDSVRSLNFLLKYNMLDIEELDTIKAVLDDFLRKGTNKEHTDTLSAMIQQAFNEFYFQSEAQKVMERFSGLKTLSSSNLDQACLSFSKSINLLTWQHNRLTFSARLRYCSEIMEKLIEIEELTEECNYEQTSRSELEQKINDLNDFIRLTEEEVCGKTRTVECATTSSIAWLLEISGIKSTQSKQESQPKKGWKEMMTINNVVGAVQSKVSELSLHRFSESSELKLRRILFDFDQLSFNKAEDLESFNMALNKLQKTKFNTDKAHIDYLALRKKFLECWPSLYLLKWSKPLDEISQLREQIRKNWELSYVNCMAHKIAERGKALRRMNILLAKYACQASLFASPGQSLEKWRSLAKEAEKDWSCLEELLAKRAVNDFVMMKLLAGHVGVQAQRFQLKIVEVAKAAGVDLKNQKVSVDVVTALRRAQARRDPMTRQDAWFVSVMDVLLFALRSAPSLDHSIGLRLAALAENVEIIVECGLVGWTTGSFFTGGTNERPFAILDMDKVQAYRKAFSDSAALAESCGKVRDRLLGILDVVEDVMLTSERLVERLDARVRHNNSTFTREVESLGLFVSMLSKAVLEVESATGVCLGDVVHASATVLNNQHTMNTLGIYRDKKWSVLQRFYIWNETFNPQTENEEKLENENAEKTENGKGKKTKKENEKKTKDVQSRLLELSSGIWNATLNSRSKKEKKPENKNEKKTENRNEKKPENRNEKNPKDIQSWLLELVDCEIDPSLRNNAVREDEAKVAIRLSVAANLLHEHFEIASSNDSSKAVIDFLVKCSQLLEKNIPKNPEKISEEITRCLAEVQSALFSQLVVALNNRNDRLCGEVNHRSHISPMETGRNDLAQFYLQDKLEQLTIVSSFLGRTPIEANQLALRALTALCLEPVTSNESAECFLGRFVNDVCGSGKVCKYSPKKREVLASVYDVKLDDGKQFAVNFVEKSVIHRWITMKRQCAINDDGLKKIIDWIHSMKKAEGSTKSENSNRLWGVFGFDLLTEEEVRYTRIVGRVAAENMLKNIVPNLYLHVLRTAAIKAVYWKLISLFYPDLKANILEEVSEVKGTTANETIDPRIRLVLRFKRAFDRAHFFAKRADREFEWLVWLDCTVLPSLRATKSRVTLNIASDLLFASAECELDTLFKLTLSSRPQHWIEDLTINSMNKTTSSHFALDPNKQDEAMFLRMAGDMRVLLHARHNKGRTFIKMLASKLDYEAQLVTAFADPIDCSTVAKWIAGLKTIENVTETELGRFAESPVRQWPKLIRHIRLRELWGLPSLATHQLVNVLDRRYGTDATDRFLQSFAKKFNTSEISREQSSTLLSLVLRNISRHPWTAQKAVDLANGHGSDEDWYVLQDENLIKQEMYTLSKEALSAEQLMNAMKDDVECKKLIGDTQRQTLTLKVEEIRKWRDKINGVWTSETIKTWATTYQQQKNEEIGQPPHSVAGFLAVASVAVFLNRGYYPRDSQLLGVLLFTTSSDNSKDVKRMAQISTGEGKTLITALLAAYYVLSNWSGKRNVNVITSSSVLAEANVVEIEWFFKAFSISATNNCDVKCANDEDERSRRYNSDIVYGDLASFQRDELLSEFFGKDVTKGRKAGALIVDEVDSMLLDKGENLLYLSHKIPEMDDLMSLFVDIWYAVHDPLASIGNEEALNRVKVYVEERIKRGETIVPVCLRSFVDRQLLEWIRSAYRAKKKLSAKDAYKVDDVGDGRGKQIVVMDKETGVEQVNMQWTHGLHQFLQLKHGLRVSPVSLKAVFMSNIGFFKNRHQGTLYGLTGTLGSEAECDLLRATFEVDFFRMPRFKRRFCWEEEPFVSHNRNQWLDNVKSAVKLQISKGRALLVICESIVAAEAIYQKLRQIDNSDNNGIDVALYVSSFDESFQDRQHEAELKPGDVIVATNLAGRGTDFKIGAQLAANGGLHVIISYVPQNARVEDQAQGRTGRAGQLGSFQFVVNRRSVLSGGDSHEELVKLKSGRDAAERRRLEHIRTKGLQRIFLEETLFSRFQCEVYEPVKKELANCLPQVRKLQLDFLTNRWALWLDENAELIRRAHSQEANAAFASFEKLKTQCLEVSKATKPGQGNTDEEDVIRFAKMPSELLKLGRAYESVPRPDAAKACYKAVLIDEPNNEAALILYACTELQNADSSQKKKAKPLLAKALGALRRKFDVYSTANQIMQQVSNVQREISSSSNMFSGQISNLLSLLQVHETAIRQLVGTPCSQSIAQTFANESEARELADAILKELGRKRLIKPFRVSKKISFCDDRREIFLPHGRASIEWHSMLEHCKEHCITILMRAKTKSNCAVTKADFNEIASNCQSLWEILKKEGYIEEEQIYNGFYLSGDCDGQNVPTSGVINEAVLKDWLERHRGEEFYEAVNALCLDSDIKTQLRTTLEEKSIVVKIDCRKGRLVKEIITEEENEEMKICSLPDSLKQFSSVLSAWEANLPEDRMVCREDIPLPANEDEAVDLIWNFLIANRVIKEPKLLLSRDHCDGKVASENRMEEIYSAVKGSVEIQRVFNKYNPSKEIQEFSTSDVLSYIKSNPINSLGNAVLGLPNYQKFGEMYGSKVKEWLNEKRRDEEFEEYARRISQALTNSAGQLKTIPVISAKFTHLSDHFMHNFDKAYPEEEILSFGAKSADLVLSVEKLWQLDWRAMAVVGLGLIQVVTGIALSMCTFGGAALISGSLIQGGVSDMIFGAQAAASGSFSWNSYRQQKLWNTGLAVLTCGIGSYLTYGAKAGQTGIAAFQGKVGLSLMMAIGKKTMVTCANALINVTSSWAVERFLTWLKDVVFGGIIRHLKSAVRFCLSKFHSTLISTLDGLRDLFEQQGKSFSEAVQSIREMLRRAKQRPSQTAWISQLSSTASSVVGAVGSAYSQAGDIFKAQESVLITQGFDMFDQKNPNGMSSITDASKSNDMATKWIKWGKLAYKLVELLKHGTEVVTLVSHAPLYMTNVNDSLQLEKRELSNNLERSKVDSECNAGKQASFSTSSTVRLADRDPNDDQNELLNDEDKLPPTIYHAQHINQNKNFASQEASEAEEWAKFKEEIQNDLEGEVVRFMVDKVSSAWVQPWLQAKLESSIRSLGERAVNGIASCFSEKATESNSNDQSTAKNENDSNDDKSTKEETNQKVSEQTEELEKQLGEGALKTEVDKNGNVIAQPKDYKEVVDTLGQGRTAGLLEMQMVADFLAQPLEVVEENPGDFTGDSTEQGNKPFSVAPNGDKTNQKPPIRVRYKKNDDGTNHVDFINDKGEVIEIKQDPNAPPNRCLYEAIAHAKGCSVDKLLTNLKQHAANNKLAQYLYDKGVDEVLPELRCGRSRTLPDVYYEMNGDEKNYKVERVITTLSKTHVGKAKSNVKPDQREQLENLKDMVRKNDKLNPAEKRKVLRKLNSSKLSHVLAESLGGTGELGANNIIFLLANVNDSSYARMERKLSCFLKSSKNFGAKVHLNIIFNEGVEDGNFFCPMNVRFVWHYTVKNREGFVISDLLMNDTKSAKLQTSQTKDALGKTFKCEENVNVERAHETKEIICNSKTTKGKSIPDTTHALRVAHLNVGGRKIEYSYCGKKLSEKELLTRISHLELVKKMKESEQNVSHNSNGNNLAQTENQTSSSFVNARDTEMAYGNNILPHLKPKTTGNVRSAAVTEVAHVKQDNLESSANPLEKMQVFQRENIVPPEFKQSTAAKATPSKPKKELFQALSCHPHKNGSTSKLDVASVSSISTTSTAKTRLPADEKPVKRPDSDNYHTKRSKGKSGKS